MHVIRPVIQYLFKQNTSFVHSATFLEGQTAFGKCSCCLMVGDTKYYLQHFHIIWHCHSIWHQKQLKLRKRMLVSILMAKVLFLKYLITNTFTWIQTGYHAHALCWMQQLHIVPLLLLPIMVQAFTNRLDVLSEWYEFRNYSSTSISCWGFCHMSYYSTLLVTEQVWIYMSYINW